MKNFLRRLIEKYFLDIFFAKRCLSCSVSENAWVCGNCKKVITNSLGSKSFEIGEGVRCEYFFDFKEGPLRELLHNLKYNGLWDLGAEIARIIEAEFLKNIFSDGVVLIPVPVSKKRLSQRGYNQVEMIAQALAAETGLIVCSELLVRAGKKKSQVGRNKVGRKEALSGQFEMAKHPCLSLDKKIILMDDVVVTGSTLLECREVLLRSGYTNVTLLAIAREV